MAFHCTAPVNLDRQNCQEALYENKDSEAHFWVSIFTVDKKKYSSQVPSPLYFKKRNLINFSMGIVSLCSKGLKRR